MELDEMAEAAVAAAREVIGGPREHWKDDREIDKTLARIGAEVRKRLAPALAAVAAEVRQADEHRSFAVRLARGVEVSWRETVLALVAAQAEVDALRGDVARLRVAAGTVVRGAAFGDGTAEVDGQALVDLAAARLPRVRPTDPVEVDEDAVGDLPRGPVMP